MRVGNYVLGLELGVASLGWAALTLDAEDKPCAVLAIGARKFPTGTIGDIASGRDVSRNQRRQDARSRRVQLARRVERLHDVWRLLQGAGLLPSGRFKERDAILKRLDSGTNRAPYVIRAKALDGAVTAHELGRALYHVAQRRGFQSNRRDSAKDDEELGVVKKGIAELETAIAASGARTLGEYLCQLQGPLRRRWTSRAMYRTEIDLILAAQKPHHPALTGTLCQKLTELLFGQRPLKSRAHLIGRCELEPARRRMPLAMPDAQEFRVLQRINDLRLVEDVGVEPVELTAAQRVQLLSVVQNGDATFAAIRKALSLPKTVRFNAERVDEKTLIGCRTEARMRAALKRWGSMPENDRRATVEALVTIDEENGLRGWLRRRGFAAEEVEMLVNVRLEPGYLNHSHKAVAKLLPRLRAGEAYSTARKGLYPDVQTHKVRETLPLVSEAYPHLANPLVNRALYEVRVIVNALVAKYGRPKAIRVSLMRELRLGRRSREQIQKRQWKQQRVRAAGAARILKDMGVQEPPRWMVDKVLLADECGWTCPFTGKTISMRSLIGGEPKFEVAHIVPLHQSLDDSFANKTLCHVSRLVETKALRRHDDKTIERFGKFVGSYAETKLLAIKLTPEEIVERYGGEVVAAHFVDSCYASKLAADYVSLLFPPNSADVSCTRGTITSYVREACGLNRIDLPRGSFKRHAIDAAAVAASGPGIVRRLTSAAQGILPGRRRFAPEIAMPWPSFTEDVRRGVEALNVSVRVDRRVSGALHEETFYAAAQTTADGKSYHTVRKHLWQLTATDLPHIEGSDVRAAVVAKVEGLGGGDPRKLFANAANLPTHRGAATRRVRVRRYEQAFPIGAGDAKRWVTNEENHHLAAFVNAKGETERAIVSQFEAQRRKVKREPVVQIPEGTSPLEGLGTLAVGETVVLDKKLMTVRSVSKDPRVVMVAIDDSRTLADIIASKELVRLSVDQLRKKGARKVVVSPLGEVRNAND